MITYVLGFIFTPCGYYLIHKNRGPADVVGKWNGIGGKVKPGESAHAAMSREAVEEGGPGADQLDWLCFGTMGHRDAGNGHNWTCWLFAAEIIDMTEPQPETATDEEVRWFADDEPPSPMVGNVPMLMEMARYALANNCDDGENVDIEITYR